MKNGERPKRPRKTKDEMRAEYRFDYTKARPNRFTSRIKDGTVAVILDPDVAEVFRSSDAVNAFFRSVISTLPKQNPKRAKAGRSFGQILPLPAEIQNVPVSEPS